MINWQILASKKSKTLVLRTHRAYGVRGSVLRGELESVLNQAPLVGWRVVWLPLPTWLPRVLLFPHLWGGVLPWVLSSDRHRRLIFVRRHVDLCVSIGHLHPFPVFSLGCPLTLFWVAGSTMVAPFISILLSLKRPSLAVILQIQPPLWHLLWPLNLYSEAELVFYSSAIYNLMCSGVIICLHV